MQEGDVIKIDGRLGFLMNPEMIVVDIKPGMVKLKSTTTQNGGILSGLNESWYGIDIIESKIKTT